MLGEFGPDGLYCTCATRGIVGTHVSIPCSGVVWQEWGMSRQRSLFQVKAPCGARYNKRGEIPENLCLL